MLSDDLIRRVVEFDREKRACGKYGGRRYGSVTGDHATNITEAWRIVEHPGTDGGRPPTRKTLRYNVIVPYRPRVPGERVDVLVVHVAVRLNRAYTPVVKEVARIDLETGDIEYRDMGYHGLGGWVVYWDRADWSNKAIRAWIRPACSGVCEHERYRRRGALTFPWHETVNPDALKGTRYEWCQWPGKYGLVEWLMLYRSEPKIELLAKLGLFRLCTPVAAKALHAPAVRKYLQNNLATLQKNQIAYDAREFVWAARRNLPIGEAVRHYELVKSFMNLRVDLKGIRLDYERLRKMLPKWKADVHEYSRYLDYARLTGIDIKCEGVLYPPVGRGETSFHARLERLEAEYDRQRRRERRRERREQRERAERERRELADLMAKRLPEIAAFQSSLDRAKILDLGTGVKAVLARTQDELRVEGRKMHNCVGMGHYGEGIVRGNTLILMFRVGGKPFCDVEIDRRNWSVRQCYFAHNKPATQDYRDAADKIAEYLKKLDAANRKRARGATKKANVA